MSGTAVSEGSRPCPAPDDALLRIDTDRLLPLASGRRPNESVAQGRQRCAGLIRRSDRYGDEAVIGAVVVVALQGLAPEALYALTCTS